MLTTLLLFITTLHEQIGQLSTNGMHRIVGYAALVSTAVKVETLGYFNAKVLVQYSTYSILTVYLSRKYWLI